MPPEPTPQQLLRTRLEHYRGGEIDLAAWIDFLDGRLTDEQQQDDGLVFAAWAEFLEETSPREYGAKAPAGAPAPPRAFPGTPEKMAVLARRFARRQPLFRRHGDPQYAD